MRCGSGQIQYQQCLVPAGYVPAVFSTSRFCTGSVQYQQVQYQQGSVPAGSISAVLSTSRFCTSSVQCYSAGAMSSFLELLTSFDGRVSIKGAGVGWLVGSMVTVAFTQRWER